MRILIAALLLAVPSLMLKAQSWDWVVTSRGYNARSLGIGGDSSGNVVLIGVNSPDRVEQQQWETTAPRRGYYWSTGKVWDEESVPSGSGLTIMKFSSDGDLHWGRAIHGTVIDGSARIALDRHGNIFITGQIDEESDFIFEGEGEQQSVPLPPRQWQSRYPFLARISPAGHLDWIRILGDPFIEISSLAIGRSGRIYVGTTLSGEKVFLGDTVGTPAMRRNQHDVVACLDSLGHPLWRRAIASLRESCCTIIGGGAHVGIDADENVYIGCAYIGSSLVEGGAKIVGPAKAANNRTEPWGSYVVSYNRHGTFRRSLTLGGIASLQDMVVSGEGDVTITGTFLGNIGVGAIQARSDSTWNVFVAGISNKGKLTWIGGRELATLSTGKAPTAIACNSKGMVALASENVVLTYGRDGRLISHQKIRVDDVDCLVPAKGESFHASGRFLTAARFDTLVVYYGGFNAWFGQVTFPSVPSTTNDINREATDPRKK